TPCFPVVGAAEAAFPATAIAGAGSRIAARSAPALRSAGLPRGAKARRQGRARPRRGLGYRPRDRPALRSRRRRRGDRVFAGRAVRRGGNEAVWTPFNPADAGMTPDRVSKFGEQSPMGRPAQPEEVAPAYVFLASEGDSSFITGTVVQMMGGETIGG